MLYDFDVYMMTMGVRSSLAASIYISDVGIWGFGDHGTGGSLGVVSWAIQ